MKLQEGAQARLGKTISEADILMYAAVSLDTNPVHLDGNVAAESPFGSRIAHGLLTAGLVSACLGTRLPGPGTIYLTQSLRFTAPVFIGDTVTATVEVLEIQPKGRVRLSTSCINQHGKTVLDGEALVLAPKEELA